MRRIFALPLLLAGAAAAAAACAACSSASPAAGSSPSPASPASPGPAAAACPGTALHVIGLFTQVSTMPGIVTTVSFRNDGRAVCTVTGWPAVTVTGPRAARRVPVRDQADTAAWTIARTRVTLRPGASATSSLLIAAPNTAARCGPAVLAVRPPAAPGPATVLRPVGAPQLCAGDTIVVSPAYPGQQPLVHFGPSPGHSPT